MNLETGTPVIEGRYVAYVPGILDWLEPVLVTWNRGDWHYKHSTEKYPDQVHFWIGPLPVVMLDPAHKYVSADPTAQSEFPDECSCQSYPTHQANDCPLHGLEPPHDGLEYDL